MSIPTWQEFVKIEKETKINFVQGFEASDAGIFPCLLQNKKVASEKHQTFMEVEQARPQQKPGKLFSKETQ